MGTRTLLADVAIGMAAGYLATKVTDRAQTGLWHATPDRAKEQEPDVSEPSARSAARLLCERFGIEPSERELELLKTLIHYGLGAGWGTLYGFMRRYSRMTPVGAGLVTGTSLSIIIDEALNPAFGITPPSEEFPASAHVRGLLTHMVYGLAVAAAAESLHQVTPHSWR